MKPLAVHGGVAATIWFVCAAAWALFELGLAIRVRGASGRDRSFVPLTLAVVGGMALGQFVARRAGLTLPGPGWWPVALGVVVFVLGLALRACAVRELGRFFKFTVVVQSDHRVVDTGPYRLIRHPSYTGLLVVELGLGIMLGTWLSIPACLLPPLAAFAIRLLTEERVLARELGEPYRAYMVRTKRLVPGVW
jgi:protein-S-isoprenylcysteine O-methyltransferase Ste14